MSILIGLGEQLGKKDGKERKFLANNYKIAPEDKNGKIHEDALFFLVGHEGLKELDYLNDKDNIPYYEDRLKLSLLTTMNKVILNKGNHKKQNQSLTPFTINFKIDTLLKNLDKLLNQDNLEISMKEAILNICKETFSLFIEEIEDVSYLDELNIQKKECFSQLEDNIDDIIEKIEGSSKKAVKIVFDLPIAYFEKANEFFFNTLKNVFGVKTEIFNYENKDKTYGYNPFINRNKKKPFLVSKVKSSTEEAMSLMAIKSEAFGADFTELGFTNILIKAKKRTDDIYIYEYDTKEVEFKISRNEYLGSEKRNSVGEVSLSSFYKFLEQRMIDKNKIELCPMDVKILSTILKNNEFNRYKYYKFREMIIRELIKYGTINKLEKNNQKLVFSTLNTILSIDDYLFFQENNKERTKNMGTIKKIQELETISEINNDEEYSYLLGQVVHYINSQGAESKKNKTIGYIGKYVNKKECKSNLLDDFLKYKQNIYLSDKLTSIVPKIIDYDVKSLNKGMFLAGVLDNNIFYKKKIKTVE